MNKDQDKKSIEAKIIETIDKYITPSVELHGGKIELLSYDKEDQHVHVKLSGSCAGCASSIYTLKMGVEQILQHYFPKDIKSISHEEGEVTNPYY
jgi:Fe-S cluster biogenesis protein NfuA|tara:strand:- start:273 stop:557 length:285 start_codon:yes stop_codon:yes gene_type:complete